MSSPFYGLRPVYLPFSGTTDANGNLTLTLLPRIGFWFTGKLVGQVVAGSPAWRISDGVIPLGHGRGQRAEIAGVVAPPAASLVLDVLAAQATTAVTGSLIGVQGPDMQTIAQAFVMAPNTVAADIASPTIVQTQGFGVGSFAAPVTIPVPKGTQAIGYAFEPAQSGFANLTGLTIIGNNTAISYFNQAGGFSQVPVAVPFDTADTAVIVNVTVSAPTFARPSIDILAWQTPVATFVQTVPGGPALSDDVTDRLARLVGRVIVRDPASAVDANVNADGSLRVQEGNFPPPWQSPQQVVEVENAAGTSPFTVVAGVNGQTIRVFGWELQLDSTAAIRVAFLQPVGVGARRFGMLVGSSQSSGPGYHGGVPLPVNLGIECVHTAIAGENVRASVSFSQS